jgi:hypothetical protein
MLEEDDSKTAKYVNSGMRRWTDKLNAQQDVSVLGMNKWMLPKTLYDNHTEVDDDGENSSEYQGECISLAPQCLQRGSISELP